MSQLKVGRCTITTPLIRSNRSKGTLEIQCMTSFVGESEELHGVARGLRNDLQAHIGELIPVVWDGPASITGYYVLRTADLQTINPGSRFDCTLTFDYVGSAQEICFESRIVAATAENDFSITTSEVTNAPPIGHKGYRVRESSSVSRGVAYEGTITVYRSLTLDDSGKVSKVYSLDPSDYYRGAATVSRRQTLIPEYGPIVGTEVFIESIEDIEITNGIVRFWIDGAAVPWVGFWDGTAWRDYAVFFLGEGLAAVSVWNYVAILKNNPEECILRYEGGAEGAVSLTVSLARGALGIGVVEASDVETRLGVYDALATEMTVTSNRSFYTAADGSGHKLGFISLRFFSSIPANGYIYVDDADRFDVFITNQLSGAATGNQAVALGAQYMSVQAEDVRSVLR